MDPAKVGCPGSLVLVHKMLEGRKGKAWQWDEEADRWEHLNH